MTKVAYMILLAISMALSVNISDSHTKSEIRKKNEHLYSLYTKILEERVQTGQYR